VSGLSVFAFGKLPTHGDFVARGLDAGARQAWDDWASSGLSLARERLAEAFPAAHDAAPPWRFAFGAPRFGAGRQAGAFAASIDAAGRRFLIVLGARAEDGLAADGPGAAVAEILEDQIYRGFGEACAVDDLVAGAARALDGVAAGPAAAGVGRFWTLGGADQPAQEVLADAPPDDLLLRVLQAEA
jgi:type VI secretion system protein ImpM